jgi:DNA-binding GntR family transcriptional regulator
MIWSAELLEWEWLMEEPAMPDRKTGGAGGGSEPVKHYMLGDQVKDQILTRILEGELSPGSRIVETRIARELGTSQGPVREALRDLATLGLVDLQPYRGARVRKPTTQELQEAMTVRAELEAVAATEASATMTEESLGELRRLVAEMCELAAAGVVPAYVRKNTEFHRTVMRASGNRTLERLWELLEPFARTYITAAASGVSAERSYRSHIGIVDALASGDARRAADAMRLHSRETQRLVMGQDENEDTQTAKENPTQ